MANEKTFKYKIVTQVDGSAIKSLETSLKSITSSIDSVSNNFKKLGNTIDSALKGSKSQVDSLISSLKGVVSVFGAIGLAKSALSSVWNFGKMTIEAAKFRQTMLSSLDIFYKGQSKGILDNSIKVAGLTAADTRPLLEYVQDLASSGFSVNQLKKLEVLRADVESAGGSQSTLDSMANVFKVAAGGGAPELGADFIQKFLGKSNYVRYQAKAIGAKDWENGNLDTLNKQVNDARKSGKLTPTLATQGLEEAALFKMGQNKVGDYSRKIAEGSLAGALSNLSSTLDDMFLTLDLDKMPGIEGFRKVITEIGTTLRGPEFQGALKDLIGAVFKPFENIKEGKVKDTMLWLLQKAQEIWNWIKKLFTDPGGAFKDILEKQKEAFIYLGKLIGQGIRAAFNPFSEDDPEVKEKDNTAARAKAEEDRQQAQQDQYYRDTYGSVPTPGNGGFQLPDMGSTQVIVNMELNGDIDPKEAGREAASQTKAALDKAQAKKNAIKAGKSK